MDTPESSNSSQFKPFGKRGRALRRNAKNILDQSYNGDSALTSNQNISSSYQIDDPLYTNQDSEYNVRMSSNITDFSKPKQKSQLKIISNSQIDETPTQNPQDEEEVYDDGQFEEVYQLATKNIKLKKYDIAIKQLEELIQQTQNSFSKSKAKCQLGSLFQIVGREDVALELYTSSLQDNILNETTHLNIGILYLQKYLQNRVENNKCISSALNHLNQSIRLNSKSYEANFHIAQAFLEQNNSSQGEIYLSKCIKLNPDNPKGHRLLAGVFHDQKKYDKAKEHYLRAINIRPTDKDYFNIGSICMHQNNFIEAQQYLIKCISVNDQFTSAYINLGLIHFMNNEYDESEKYYQSALEIDEYSFEALSNMGNLQYHKRNLQQAEEFYRRAQVSDQMLNQNNQNAYLLLNMGRVQYELNQLESSLTNLLNSFELDDQLYYALKIIADIYSRLDQSIKAEIYLEQYTKIEKKDADALFKLAGLQYKTLQYTKAHKSIVACLKVKPNHPKALTMLNELENVIE